MYIWTASGTGTAGFHRATGVSDDPHKARAAAEGALRTGHACTACIERVYTAVAAPALSLCYVHTGTGWHGHLGQAGCVEWTPFTASGEPEYGEMAAAEAAAVVAAAAAAASGQHRGTQAVREAANAGALPTD